MSISQFVTPKPVLDKRFAADDNVFRTAFGQLSHDEWVDVLVRSISDSNIQDIQFPTFPDESLQSQIHGHSGAHSIREAATFYNFVRVNTYNTIVDFSDSYFLDFAAGWGRISRLFLRDFSLKRMFAYEPDLALCAIGRSCNPYINFMCGDHLPERTLPGATFNLVVGWSIFSHLSENSAMSWLQEMGRILRPGGQCVFTTWGLRFLERLQREARDAAQDKPIHWYSRVCIDAAGSLDEQIDRYNNGDFVWFTSGQSKSYGEAFFGSRTLDRLLRANDLPFDIAAFDTNSLAQDAFILIRRAN